MKRIFILIVSLGVLLSCTREKTIEERYLYEGEKIVDVDTGDEYIMEEDPGQFTILRQDGTAEKIDIEETPFFGTTLSDQYVKDWRAGMEKRQERLLLEKKNQIKEARRARYADLSDEELLKKFQSVHKQKGEMTLQREMISELIERGAISIEDAPDLLEIDPEFVDLDIDIDKLD